MTFRLETQRLYLQAWSRSHVSEFRSLHADPKVMADQGGAIPYQRSDDKLQRYIDAYAKSGYARWHVTQKNGQTVGYCGVMPVRRAHPLGEHDEIGWRLFPGSWGQGFAVEAARAALTDVFERTGIDTVYAYTVPDNHNSQRVMEKLGLRRDPDLDFLSADPRLDRWQGMVWKAQRGM